MAVEAPLGYLRAARHPWASLWFLLPLLAAYEGGVFGLAENSGQAFRNGADAWLRWVLEVFGVSQMLALPAVVVTVLLLWSWCRWNDRPTDLIGTCFAMAFESFLLACLLYLISRNFGVILDRCGVLHYVVPTMSIPTFSHATLARIITFVGAGIYEEVLFRLVIFGGLVLLLGGSGLPKLFSVPLALLASSLLFAAAHHIGPFGERFEAYVFLFRMTAGVYFALLYQLRGFGIAVGAHAGYDILVGILVQPTA